MSLNFSYGIIAIVGVLVAISIGFIAVSPDYVPEPRVVGESVKSTAPVLPMSLIVSLPTGSGVPGCDETNECFLPYDGAVAKGATVTWNNDDSAAHTVTSGTPSGGPDGNFDSSLFMAGGTYSVTLDTAGEYPYFCMVHPWMIGNISVN